MGEEVECQSNWEQNENGSQKMGAVLRGKEATREPIGNAQFGNVLAAGETGLDGLLDMAVEEKDYDTLDCLEGNGVLDMP